MTNRPHDLPAYKFGDKWMPRGDKDKSAEFIMDLAEMLIDTFPGIPEGEDTTLLKLEVGRVIQKGMDR